MSRWGLTFGIGSWRITQAAWFMALLGAVAASTTSIASLAATRDGPAQGTPSVQQRTVPNRPPSVKPTAPSAPPVVARPSSPSTQIGPALQPRTSVVRPIPPNYAPPPTNPRDALRAPPPATPGDALRAPPPPAPFSTIDAEPDEVLIVGADLFAAQINITRVSQLGFALRRRQVLGQLGMVLDVVRTPAGLSVPAALDLLRQRMPDILADANTIYRLAGTTVSESPNFAARLIGWNRPPRGCGAGLRLGMIDTAVDAKHPALRGRTVVYRPVLPEGAMPGPSDHGTAVAAIMVGNAIGNEFSGLLPGATLHAAGIFRRNAAGGVDATLDSIARAFDWLAAENVSVANLSFAGAGNLVMQLAVQRLQHRGVILVAAAGNNGPMAPPAYPAAYPGVIAVTAVDAEMNIYGNANRGDYVALAAPGVDVWIPGAAAKGTNGSRVTGTSFAAPFVSAVAVSLEVDPSAPVLERLRRRTVDLGPAGKDIIYGWGLIQESNPCERPSLAAAAPATTATAKP